MRIIEGKQAVLKPYRTERECVLPKQGQVVLPLEPVECPVRELSTAICSLAAVSDAEISRPVAYEAQKISDIAVCKPIESETQTLQCAGENIQRVETQVPKNCVLQRVSEADMQKPVKCPIQEMSEAAIQSMAESASHIDDITISNLQTTEAQLIPATPELEQIMEETESRMSRMKKKKWFADKIFHITNSQ